MSGERVFVGLGSNLADPISQILRALEAMGRIPGTRIRRRSSLYANPPLGAIDQPHYVNAVAELFTPLAPNPLLSELQSIERAQGRVRGANRWKARTLDLDLLLYGDRMMHSRGLILPHSAMHERAFVLHPLAEIDPDVSVPGHGLVSLLASRVSAESLLRVDEAARV